MVLQIWPAQDTPLDERDHCLDSVDRALRICGKLLGIDEELAVMLDQALVKGRDFLEQRAKRLSDWTSSHLP